MGKLLRWLKHTYGDQVFLISENGVSDRTGTLRDQHRIDYIKVSVLIKVLKISIILKNIFYV